MLDIKKVETRNKFEINKQLQINKLNDGIQLRFIRVAI